jgi:hypothetical protein
MVLTKYEILARDGFQCQKCGKLGLNLQAAHRIKQGNKSSKKNSTVKHIHNYVLRKYKRELTKQEIYKIIHDERNLVTSCDKCNDYFNIFFKPVERDQLIDLIYEKEIKEVSNEN